MNKYHGSSFAEQAHGFGRLETEEWVHVGWFEFDKPTGFGTRYYTSNGQVDAGLWENDCLVKLTSGPFVLFC